MNTKIKHAANKHQYVKASYYYAKHLQRYTKWALQQIITKHDAFDFTGV